MEFICFPVYETEKMFVKAMKRNGDAYLLNKTYETTLHEIEGRCAEKGEKFDYALLQASFAATQDHAAYLRRKRYFVDEDLVNSVLRKQISDALASTTFKTSNVN